MTLRRRSLLIGTGVAALGATALPEDTLRLFFPDDARRSDVVIRYGTRDTVWNAKHFGESATLAISRMSDPYRPLTGSGAPSPSPQWLANRWQLIVENTGFPGGPVPEKPLKLTFAFERPADMTIEAPLGAWKIRLDAEHWPQPGRTTHFAPIPLGLFLDNWTRLETTLAAAPAQSMLEGWFGKRIETTDAITLSLGTDLQWQVESPNQRLFILDLATPDTSSPFGFSKLELIRTFPEQAAAQPAKSGQPARERPAASQPAATAPAKPTSSEQDRLFAEFKPTRSEFKPTGKDQAAPNELGLYGILSRPSEQASPAKARFEFATTEAPGAIRAMITLGDVTGMRAALRQWGNPAFTAAGIKLAPELEDEKQAKNDDAPNQRRALLSIEPPRQTAPAPTDPAFEIAHFQIVRQRMPDPAPGRADKMVDITLAQLTPRNKEHLVQTPFGPMEVRAAPKVPPAPGKPARAPAIDLRAIDAPGPQGRRLLDRFEAILSLHSAGVRLPVTAAKPAAGPRRADEPIARLEFHDAECRFALPGIAPGIEIVAADALVPLGPKAGDGDGAILDLGRASLRVMRPSDLLSLKYRFSGLLLRLPLSGPTSVARVLPNRGGPVCRGASPADAHPTRDLRPIMVVEFPPQHVAERAYFRQIPTIVFPVLDVRNKTQLQDWLTELRALARPPGADPKHEARKARLVLRRKIKDGAPTFVPHRDDAIKEFERLAALAEGKRRPLPLEQRIYLGPDFLDAAARRLMRDVLTKRPEPSTLEPIAQFKLTDAELKAVLAPLGLVPAADGAKTVFDPANLDPLQQKAAFEVELAKDKLNKDYAEFRQAFGIIAQGAWQGVGYLGAAWFEKVGATLPDKKAFVDGYETRQQEKLEPVTEARLSGPSRLAFRINCDDFQAERQGGGFAFSLEGLTDWGSMDLAVVRRAERLVAPPARGPRPPRWAQVYDLDDATMLRHIGLSGGDHIAAKTARTAHGAPSDKPRYLLPPRLITPAQRLAEVAGSARQPPDPFQTAIELPFRLFLSPAQDATWRVPNPAIREKAFPGAEPPAFRELWSASLAGSGVQAGVRAIWSPDFRPDALTSIEKPSAPPRGPWAPWSLSGTFGLRTPPDLTITKPFRTTMDAYDRHEIVTLSSVHGLPVLGKRDNDGSLKGGSQFEPPVGFALSGLEPNSPPTNQDGITLEPRDYSAIYRPQPLLINELSLTALGGNLDHDTAFTPPASARRVLDGGGAVNLFDALSIERWRNRTVLGRDIAVEIVYKGFLFPIGHKAALVKLTERRFEESSDGRPVAVLTQRLFLRVGDPEKRFPAFLHPNEARRWPARRVEMLTRRTPDLAPYETPVGGKITLDNVTSTGTIFWPRTAPRDGAEVQFEMRIDEEGAAGAMPLIFVDNTAAHDSETIKALVEYYRTTVDAAKRRLPRNGQGVRMAPSRKTGDTTYVTDWWELLAEGRTVAPTSPKDPVNTVTLDNGNHVMDPFMEGLDQPGFYPLVYKAKCRLTQVEKMTGRQTVWAELSYDGYYVARGFQPGADPSQLGPAEETFLQVVGDPVSMRMADGERSGGLAQPNTNVVGLSRETGPVGASAKLPSPPNPPPPLPDPKTANSISKHSSDLTASKLFPEDARLLGLVKLSDIVKLGLSKKLRLGDQPKLKEITEYGASEAAGIGSAARGFITDTVLRPMQAGVTLLETQWNTLAEANPFLQDVTLATAFPQIGDALKLLETTLEQSLQPSLDDVAFFASLADIYEAGRGLVAVIEEILRDPVASLSATQSTQLRNLIDTVQSIAKTLSDPKAVLIDALQTAYTEVQKKLLNDAPWRRLFFMLPSLPPDDPDADAFDTACQNALSAALAQAIKDGTLDKLGETFNRELGQAATATLKTKLDEAARQIQQAAGPSADALLRQIASPRMIQVQAAGTAILAKLKSLGDEIASPTPSNLAKIPGDVLDILTQASILLNQPITIPGLNTVCAGLTSLQITVAKLPGLVVPLDDPTTPFTLVALGAALVAPPQPGAPPSPPASLPAASAPIRLVETVQAAATLVSAIDAVAAALPPTTPNLDAVTAIRANIAKAGSQLAFALARVQREAAAALQWEARIQAGCKVDDHLVSFAVTLTAQRDAALDALRRLLDAAKALPGALQALAAPPIPPAARQALLEAVAAARATMLGSLRLYRAITLLAAYADPSGALEGTTNDRQTYLSNVTTGLDEVWKALPPGLAQTAVKAASDGLGQAATSLATLEGDLSSRARELRAIALINLDIALTDLAATATRIEALARDIEDKVRDAIERKAVQLVVQLGASVVPPVQNGLTNLAAPLLLKLQTAYTTVTDGRDKLKKAVTGSTDAKGLLDSFLRVLRSRLGDKLFTVACPPGAPASCADQLDYEQTLTAAALAAANANDLATMIDRAKTLVQLWNDPGAAVITILKQIATVNVEFVRNILISAIDLKQLQREIESRIRDLIPTRVTLPYDLDNELGPFPEDDPIFIPGPGTRLQLRSRTVVDLLKPSGPRVNVSGEVGPFAIALLGNRFDVVTLFFDGLSFKSGTGISADFQVRFRDVRIGEKAKFLEQLQSYLSPKGGGFYLKFLRGGAPGIEAGYGINLGVIGIGTLSFSNVILNAAVRLPFNNSEARFVISIGRSDAPFLISSTIFGGGGYLALIADTHGFVGFEASFDYGGVAAFGFGPLQGVGRLTMGIYLRKERELTSLGATFFAGGAAHIACFGFSTALMVRMVQDNGGPMCGTASYTFSFSLGIKDIDFQIQVTKNEGSNMGSSKSAELEPNRPRRTMLAQAASAVMSDATPAIAVSTKPTDNQRPKIKGVCQETDWREYRRYFDLAIRPAERWSPL